MPPPPTTPKIEELRFRLKTDPKSRLFYPLAEELRKIGACAESEQVLHAGLQHHPTYLSAWVSIGRALREQGKNRDAVEPLAKALQLDPGNVVAARLLADVYLALDEKVEAIKKYKLVHALMPGDQEVEAIIERLENALNPIVIAPMPVSEPEPEPEPEIPHQHTLETPFADAVSEASEVFAAESEEAVATGDDEPMAAEHEESPFEEPAEVFTADAVEIEQPSGIHIEEAPLAAEVPTPWAAEEEPEADVFAPAAEPPPVVQEEPTQTVTMADLYAKQGLVDDARQIYENILQREPENADVRARLDSLHGDAVASVSPQSGSREKVAKLENWLAKVARREVSHV